MGIVDLVIVYHFDKKSTKIEPIIVFSFTIGAISRKKKKTSNFNKVKTMYSDDLSKERFLSHLMMCMRH